jgi:hypothetical protein
MVLIGIPYVQTNPQGQESDSDVFDLFPLFPLFPPLPDPLPAPLPFHLRFRSPMAPGQEFQPASSAWHWNRWEPKLHLRCLTHCMQLPQNRPRDHPRYSLCAARIQDDIIKRICIVEHTRGEDWFDWIKDGKSMFWTLCSQLFKQLRMNVCFWL